MDLATLRRGVRRACFGGAAACLALAVVGSPVGAQSDELGGPRPEVFSGAANALGASIELDRPGLLPVEDIFRFVVADGAGVYQTSEQRGRASLFFPGNGLTLGPALACSQFPPEAEPVFGPILAACLQYSFPLTVTADSLAPDAATEGSLALGEPSDPISANGVGARSHAGPDAVVTAAEISDLRVLGAPAVGPLPAVPGLEDLEPYLISIGSVTANTDERIDAEGALVVDSASAVTDVGLIGGLVRIGSVVSHARVVDGDGEPVIETSLEMSGVTVAGLPATVTEDGIQIAAASGPLGPQLEALSTQLSSLLESLSFRIEPLGTEQGVDEDGISFGRVGGVLISMAVPVGGLPPVPAPPPLGALDLNGSYEGTLLLGEAGARGIAGSFDDFAASPSTGGSPAGGSTAAGGTTGAGGTATGSTGAAPGSSPAAPPAAGPAAPEAAGEGEPILDLFADRLELLYLAFTLAGFAMCLAPRLALPARLPGPQP